MKARVEWKGCMASDGGLASNLDLLAIADFGDSADPAAFTVTTTQKHCTKTATPRAVTAMRKFSESVAAFGK